MTTGPSRESIVRGRLFLTGREDREVARPRRSPENSRRESLTLPNSGRSAGRAREVTARMCAAARLSTDESERAVLLTSELVTNALVHSEGDQRLTVTTDADGVRVEVGDGSSDLPVARPRDDEATDGRGLLLLEVCASSWGARPTTRGKCVWFSIRRAPREVGDEVERDAMRLPLSPIAH